MLIYRFIGLLAQAGADLSIYRFIGFLAQAGADLSVYRFIGLSAQAGADLSVYRFIGLSAQAGKNRPCHHAGQLGVPLTMYPLYLLCSLGILGQYNP